MNARGRHGVAPLNAAALNQQLAVTELLIRHGADVDARRDDGWTPLENALERLSVAPTTEPPRPQDVATTSSIVQLLLASGAHVDVQSEGGIAPVHVAAATGQKTLVQWLLDRGADVSASSSDGATPLFIAAKRDAVDIAELLIAHGAVVDARTKSGYTPLKAAAEEGNVAVAKLLLEHGADVRARDNEGRTPLEWACNGLLTRYTLQALTPSAEVQRRKMPALQIAHLREVMRTIKGEYRKVAVILVEHGADPNTGKGEHQAMRSGALAGDKALLESLIAHGGNVNPDAENGLESPLHAAIAESHGDVAALLIDKGADVNARTDRGRTPLHFAVFYMRDRRLVELLIQHGADVNAKDREGHSPLAFATHAGEHDLVDLLRQNGARD